MQDSLGIMIKKANNALARDSDHYAKSLGLTGMQISTINFIANNEQHHDLFQRDLELEFNIRKATCSSLVSKMEAADLLIRVPAKDDGRYKRLLLTPKARQLATKIERFFEASEQRMATILGASTAETYEALRQITVAFSTPTHAPENWY